MPTKPKGAAIGSAVDSRNDYSCGIPRRHHSFYLEDGNFVIQVENAIFKIHRYFLSKHSTVLRDMLNTPQDCQSKDGTDEKPLILADDSASSWEHLLDAWYNSNFLGGSNTPSGELVLSILPIANKYCMESTEASILDQLKKASTTDAYVNLMVASRIVDSEPLYQQALTGLTSSHPKPDLVQATRIGVVAYHAIMVAESQANTRFILGLQKSVEGAKATLGRTEAELDATKKRLTQAKAQILQLKGGDSDAGSINLIRYPLH